MTAQHNEGPDEGLRRALDNPADREAFATLAARLSPLVRAALRRLGRPALDPEDVYQQCLRKLWEAAQGGAVRTFESPAQLLAYLRTLVRNTALDALRHESARRHQRLPEEDDTDSGAASREPEPSVKVEGDEEHLALEGAIARLPEDYR